MEHPAHAQSVSFNISHTSLAGYIYWSTMIGLFSGMVAIRIPFHVRLFDGIMLTNFLLMFPLVLFTRIRIPVWIPCFIFYLAFSGSIGITNGTDTIAQVSKEFSGISVSVLYYWLFFKVVGYGFEKAFSTYARIAFWFAVIAFWLWIGTCLYLHTYERLRGLTAEPTEFCALVLPAFYWYAYQYLAFRKRAIEVAVLTITIVLSGSSNGYFCAILGVTLLLSKRIKHLMMIPLVVGVLISVAYVSSSLVRMRVDDTFVALSTRDVAGSNLSTYALISNVFVTQQVLRESPLVGNGLGSHPISHARFIGDVSGVDSFIEARSAGLNAPDASSLALRVLSELGTLGFCGMMIFLYHFHVGGAETRGAISNALLVYFSMKLLRDPAYFDPEQFFFIFIYILNHRAFKHEAGARIRRATLVFSRKPSIRPDGLPAQQSRI